MEQLRSAGSHDDRTPLALAAGLVAALVGGLVWAGIVLFTNYEIGWVAWGIGGLVLACVVFRWDPVPPAARTARVPG